MRNRFLIVVATASSVLACGNAMAIGPEDIETRDLEVTIRVIDSDKDDDDRMSHKLELPDFNKESHEREDREVDREDSKSDYGDSKEDYEDGKEEHDDAVEERDEAKEDLDHEDEGPESSDTPSDD